VQKYHLPPTHELWARQPFAVHLREFFEDKYVQKIELQSQLKDGDLDAMRRMKIMDAIEILDKILDERVEDTRVMTGDPVMDALEIALDRGDDLHMDITVEEARRYLRKQGIDD